MRTPLSMPYRQIGLDGSTHSSKNGRLNGRGPPFKRPLSSLFDQKPEYSRVRDLAARPSREETSEIADDPLHKLKMKGTDGDGITEQRLTQKRCGARIIARTDRRIVTFLDSYRAPCFDFRELGAVWSYPSVCHSKESRCSPFAAAYRSSS